MQLFELSISQSHSSSSLAEVQIDQNSRVKRVEVTLNIVNMVVGARQAADITLTLHYLCVQTIM